MQAFKKYKKELSKLPLHKITQKTHILKEREYIDFAGFTEREIWGDSAQDLQNYEDWLKEQ